MSIMQKIKGRGNNGDRQDWTVSQIMLAVGMKLLGAKRKDIESATSHPANSVTYLFNRKLTKPLLDDNGKQVIETKLNKAGEEVEVKVRRPFTDEEVFSFLGVDDEQALIDHAEEVLGAETSDEEITTDDIEEVDVSEVS